ncbi:efflux RND transporter permease subunit [Fulvivirga maritima]|uniref:efflux RND transporter permease subunit n=1 Tax=Fulvivirga maritima TaxID=2904247 RepID=UPI001F29C6A4|nr:efflux RND transporter permease subunit [Fulvivirga maritima]UII28635.1 efflux RND transporter permease subunit [Fulvivirga maritima]
MNHAFKIIVCFIALSLLGWAVIPLLRIDLNPVGNRHELTISYNLPNSSPEIVEREATSPLENTFSQLTEVDEIYSVSNYNSGYVTISFSKEADINYKQFEVNTLLRQVYPKLNTKLSYPIVSSGSEEENTSPLLVYKLKASLTGYQIKKIADEHLLIALSQLHGIDEITTYGAQDLQLTIIIDNTKTQQFGISYQDVADAINSNFSINYPGLLTMNGENLIIKTGSTATDIENIKNTILKATKERAIRLKDISNVLLEESEPQAYYRINGLNSITLRITAKKGINKIVLADQIYEQIRLIKEQLPVELSISKDYDDTEFIRDELHKIYLRAGFSILILSLFIFLVNRKLKYLLVLFSGIIINLSLTLLVAWLLKIDVHIYTIAGLTIAFGLLVDNSIVMVDHLYKKDNVSIFPSLLGASLTTIAALMLVFFLPEEEKNNLLEFSQIIVVCLAISLLIAITYTPAIFSILNIKKKSTEQSSYHKRKRSVSIRKHYYNFITFLAKRKVMFLTVIVLLFGTPIFLLPAQWNDHEFYNKTIGSSTYQDHIRPYVDKALGGSLRLFIRNVFEKSTYRTPEKTQLFIHAALPYGSTLSQMNEVMQNVEAYLLPVKGIDRFITSVNSGQNSSIIIEFTPEQEHGALPYQLKSRLIAKSLDWGGVEWNIYGIGKGFSNSNSNAMPSFQVMLKGYNYDELAVQAQSLANKLLVHKRIQEVNINERLMWTEKNAKEYVFSMTPELLAKQKVSTYEIATSLREHTKPTTPSTYLNLQHSLTPVYLVSDKADNFNAYQLQHGQFQIDSSKTIDLSKIANLELQETTNAIHKENRQYLRIVSFDYFGSYKFGNDYLDKTLEAQRQELPLGFEAKKISWDWTWDKTKRQYGLILVLMAAIFMICAILFESLKLPLYIIICIPISFIGLFLIFSIFDFYFDQGGYAAFILLGGLVVNAAIFIVNDFKSYKHGIHNKNIIKAALGKAQPILLTVLSTCFGLIPFLINGQEEVFWFSLAIGTIGGLIFSLVAVFICLPVFLTKKQQIP